MQCYENLALRLALYADCRQLMPDAIWDPLVIAEVLDDNGVRDFRTYRTLESARRLELARKVLHASHRIQPVSHSRVA